MAHERNFQSRFGRHSISFSELIRRMPDGMQRHLRRLGREPERGSGRYSTINEYARVDRERRTHATNDTQQS